MALEESVVVVGINGKVRNRRRRRRRRPIGQDGSTVMKRGGPSVRGGILFGLILDVKGNVIVWVRREGGRRRRRRRGNRSFLEEPLEGPLGGATVHRG